MTFNSLAPFVERLLLSSELPCHLCQEIKLTIMFVPISFFFFFGGAHFSNSVFCVRDLFYLWPRMPSVSSVRAGKALARVIQADVSHP